jgi:hypothetical protein
METNDKIDFGARLQSFSGSERLYSHKILNSKINFTDGVKYVVEEGHAFWILELLLSYQWQTKFSKESFQCWTLLKNRDESWRMTCTDGRDKLLCSQHIQYSDFPLENLRLWLIDGVCMLPSEY